MCVGCSTMSEVMPAPQRMKPVGMLRDSKFFIG